MDPLNILKHIAQFNVLGYSFSIITCGTLRTEDTEMYYAASPRNEKELFQVLPIDPLKDTALPNKTFDCLCKVIGIEEIQFLLFTLMPKRSACGGSIGENDSMERCNEFERPTKKSSI